MGRCLQSNGPILGQQQSYWHGNNLPRRPDDGCDHGCTAGGHNRTTSRDEYYGESTGIVFNSDANGFMVNGSPATFIMDTEDGTISAWNGGSSTTLEVDNSNDPSHGDGSLPPQDQTEGIGAVYKGLAIATQKNGTTQLYATNFRHGTVDVFNDQFQQVNSLTDGNLPAGYAPVQRAGARRPAVRDVTPCRTRSSTMTWLVRAMGSSTSSRSMASSSRVSLPGAARFALGDRYRAC